MPRPAAIIPSGLRMTRPRRSMAWVMLCAESESERPKARASSTMTLACCKVSPSCPLPLLVEPVSVGIQLSLTGSDFAEEVAEEDRTGERCERPLADEIGRLIQGLPHHFARVIDYLLGVR